MVAVSKSSGWLMVAMTPRVMSVFMTSRVLTSGILSHELLDGDALGER